MPNCLSYPCQTWDILGQVETLVLLINLKGQNGRDQFIQLKAYFGGQIMISRNIRRNTSKEISPNKTIV